MTEKFADKHHSHGSGCASIILFWFVVLVILWPNDAGHMAHGMLNLFLDNAAFMTGWNSVP